MQRHETDRESTGLRLRWDRVLGTALELTFSYRDISIDTERSGAGVTSVACDTACQDLLRRDGDQYHFDASYLFRLGEGQRHLVRPMIRYTIDDRDGEAISGDAYRVQFSYIFLGQGYNIASNVAFGSASQDASNPIFGRKTDSDRFAIDTTLFYRLPTASGRWQAVGSVLWGEDDSAVDFHDSEVTSVSVGLMYRFGARVPVAVPAEPQLSEAQRVANPRDDRVAAWFRRWIDRDHVEARLQAPQFGPHQQQVTGREGAATLLVAADGRRRLAVIAARARPHLDQHQHLHVRVEHDEIDFACAAPIVAREQHEARSLEMPQRT